MNIFRRIWMRLNLRNMRAGKHLPLKRLYLLRDPWQMESEREQFRFRKLNEIITAQFGKVDALLEIGCGEGHQTAHLQQVCKTIYGVDISGLAVARARERVPNARLYVHGLLSCPDTLNDGKPFDLVVASEVLYYLRDDELPAAAEKLRRLGRHCLVSYYEHEIARLDPYFAGMPGCQSQDIEYSGTRWRVRWWTNP